MTGLSAKNVSTALSMTMSTIGGSKASASTINVRKYTNSNKTRDRPCETPSIQLIYHGYYIVQSLWSRLQQAYHMHQAYDGVYLRQILFTSAVILLRVLDILKKKKNTKNSNTIIVEIQVSETSYLMTRYDTHGMLYYDTRGYMYITQ